MVPSTDQKLTRLSFLTHLLKLTMTTSDYTLSSCLISFVLLVRFEKFGLHQSLKIGMHQFQPILIHNIIIPVMADKQYLPM